MAAEDKDSRTEKATPKQRSQAREKGQVAQSPEVGSVVSLLLGLVCIWVGGSSISHQMKDLLKTTFTTYTTIELTPISTHQLLINTLGRIAIMLAPIMLVLVVAAFVSSIMQYGFLWAPQALKLKVNQLKPQLKRLNMLSKDKLVDLGVSLAKITAISLIAYWSLKGYLPYFVPLMDESVSEIADFTVAVALRVCLRIIILLVVIAALDYLWKRHKHEENLKMTKQQVKDERKNVEGDPMIKGHIRGLQLKASMRRMMANVPEADVVITNPTHYAIALSYDAETMPAPKVVAKGARLLAERIIALAQMHHIPIVHNRPLAQALYKAVEVGGFVPMAFYHAVAEVLAYIYAIGQGRKRAAAGAAR